ncbi:hypothetical protein ACQWU4_02450 [Chryseobacterium sp. MIQD13]|uniref:hypothetical protein n=1 Tax=Chryseobacterium sp. MIQD13 TaxID=3422310 RepID=UPI003D291A7B
MKKEILKQLKSDYERLEIKPSADLWDRIDQKSEETTETVSKPSFQWWKYAAVILVLISVGTLIYYNRSGNKFDYKKTDYIVKDVLEKTVNPVNSDHENQSVISNNDPARIQSKEVKIVSENHEKLNSDKGLDLKKEKNTAVKQITEEKEQQVVAHQSENQSINQGKTEISNATDLPVIAEVQRAKSSYIDANDLLQGREYDKARVKANNDDRKFGVIHFDKVVPNVGNVTVLGVTVYLDSK